MSKAVVFFADGTEECEALLVDFPEQEKELRELSAWIAGAGR